MGADLTGESYLEMDAEKVGGREQAIITSTAILHQLGTDCCSIHAASTAMAARYNSWCRQKQMKCRDVSFERRHVGGALGRCVYQLQTQCGATKQGSDMQQDGEQDKEECFEVGKGRGHQGGQQGPTGVQQGGQQLG